MFNWRCHKNMESCGKISGTVAVVAAQFEVDILRERVQFLETRLAAMEEYLRVDYESTPRYKPRNSTMDV